jgi:hypothetical protein
MPTTRPRHTITETPPVHEALDDLRSTLGSERIDFGELVILGARAKARELRSEGATAREAREWLLQEVREGMTPVDIEAADEVKRLGLIADYDE